jgi:hypothetical protein
VFLESDDRTAGWDRFNMRTMQVQHWLIPDGNNGYCGDHDEVLASNDMFSYPHNGDRERIGYAEDASVLKCSVTKVADDGSIKFNDDNLSVEIVKDFSVQTPAGKTVKFSTEDGTVTIDIEPGLAILRKATSNRARYLLRVLPSPEWELTSYLKT